MVGIVDLNLNNVLRGIERKERLDRGLQHWTAIVLFLEQIGRKKSSIKKS